MNGRHLRANLRLKVTAFVDFTMSPLRSLLAPRSLAACAAHCCQSRGLARPQVRANNNAIRVRPRLMKRGPDIWAGLGEKDYGPNLKGKYAGLGADVATTRI